MSDPNRLSQQELESYLWGAATILRGLIDAGDYKQFIFPLLFYKRLSDVWDEEYGEALADTGDTSYALATANDHFVIPGGAHWNDVRETPRDVGRAIQTAMRSHRMDRVDLEPAGRRLGAGHLGIHFEMVVALRATLPVDPSARYLILRTAMSANAASAWAGSTVL